MEHAIAERQERWLREERERREAFERLQEGMERQFRAKREAYHEKEAAARARDRLVSRESLPERTAYIAHMCAPLADP